MNVILWQESVNMPGIYDLELDTSILSSEECTNATHERLETETCGKVFNLIADMRTQ